MDYILNSDVVLVVDAEKTEGEEDNNARLRLGLIGALEWWRCWVLGKIKEGFWVWRRMVLMEDLPCMVVDGYEDNDVGKSEVI
jgi:hypothetical protein